MRQTSNVLYIAVDGLIPLHGKSIPGLDEFTATLDHAGIPAVWITNRSRMQFDAPRRQHGHTQPFIAEDGCAVYLPEDYFHLRPEGGGQRSKQATTLRLGRFTCLPVAQPLPAAAEALESLSEDLAVPAVTLRSLSPRELVQNSGLPLREAELARQRDFDELFFFAGASDQDTERFLKEAGERKLQCRQQGVLWSLAAGASMQRCIRELSRLYDRALRYHARVVGIATPENAPNLFPYCERTILLATRKSMDGSTDQAASHRGQQFLLHDSETWERILEALGAGK